MSEPVTAVQQLQQAAQVLDECAHRLLTAEIASQRLAGASWQAIAGVLGCSRSAAHERWRYLDSEPVRVTVGKGATIRQESTGGVAGLAQTQQVELDGVISHHHPDLEALRDLLRHQVLGMAQRREVSGG